jgi:acyl-CoA synthetase (AMP-forming)/AMP-acid ligase II
MQKFIRALLKTRILGGNPWLELLRFLFLLVKHGASLYTIAVWAAGRYGSGIAVVSEQRQLSFKSLVLEVNALAARLGLQPRSRVALLFPNNTDFMVNLLASSKLGTNILLLNSKASSTELSEVVNNMDALICDEGLQHLLPSNLSLPVFINGAIRNGILPKSVPKTSRRGSITFLTSGSTGKAKQVKRRFNWELLSTLTYLLEVLTVRTERKYCLAVPLAHGHGFTTAVLALLTGSTLHIFSQPSTEAFLDRIEQHSIEDLILVPTILHRILEQPRTPNSLKFIISGSAPLTPELATRTMERFGDVLYNLYGSSETGLIAIATPADLRIAPGSVGRPLPNVQIEIRNSIHVRVGQDLIDTKDIGFIKDQYLYLLGRQDDIIVCGAEKIHPEQLEQRIMQLPYVLECAVQGIPDLEYGQAIGLFVVLKNQTLETLRADLEQLLPRASRPKQILELPELPRNAVGKLQRKHLPHFAA